MSFDKKELSEADIRTKYITPAIVKAGWNSFSYKASYAGEAAIFFNSSCSDAPVSSI